MTLDQIIMMLVDRKNLRRRSNVRTSKINPLAITGMAKDGVIMGRAKDGTLIKGRIRGKSVARQLMEAEHKKRKGG